VKHVKEGLASPYIVENCDFGNECNCALVNVIPEKARGMLFNTAYVRDGNTLLELGERRSSIV
jgi:hypothetical protein